LGKKTDNCYCQREKNGGFDGGNAHAGVDSAPANTYVKSRSGGYGAGDNLDSVKNNNMNGVFDVHFLNSKTHGTNRVDENHQKAVREAAEWAAKNKF